MVHNMPSCFIVFHTVPLCLQRIPARPLLLGEENKGPRLFQQHHLHSLEEAVKVCATLLTDPQFLFLGGLSHCMLGGSCARQLEVVHVSEKLCTKDHVIIIINYYFEEPGGVGGGGWWGVGVGHRLMLCWWDLTCMLMLRWWDFTCTWMLRWWDCTCTLPLP